MQLVLDSKGLTLAKKGQAFLVQSEKGERLIAPAKLTSIAITASISIDSSAVVLAIKHQIPILFFDHIGKARARLWSPYFESIATLRRQQIHFAESAEAAAWMVDLFYLKTEAQIENLRFMKGHSTRLSNVLNKSISDIRTTSRGFEQFRDKLPEECRSQMMGVEGSIARIYWQTIGNTLPRKYIFQKRTRRPAEDIFNAAINYLYGMMYSVVEGGLFAVGLDPHLGILHADEYRKATLSFDLIEPFRPWADRLLIEQCVQKKLKEEFFSKNQYGLFLNKHGKEFIIPLFNEFLRSQRQYLNQESTVKNHVYALAGRLAQRIRTSAE